MDVEAFIFNHNLSFVTNLIMDVDRRLKIHKSKSFDLQEIHPRQENSDFEAQEHLLKWFRNVL